jgi:hypothetical protein
MRETTIYAPILVAGKRRSDENVAATDPGSLSTLIVQRPRWQGDGRPQWLEGKGKQWERSCKTAEEATKMRKLTILRLHRLGAVEADVLADRLTTCTPSNPCASWACPVCGRSHQRWFVDQSHKLIARQPDQHFQMVSLIPDFGACPLDRISALDVTAIRLRVVRALRAAGIEFAFGGIDFSMNIDHEDDEWYLQAKFLLFIHGITEHRKEAIRKILNQSSRVKVPVHALEFDGYKAGLAYALKYEFFRRENYLQGAQVRRDDRETLNTRVRPLGGRAAAQLAILLDRLGLSNRLILVGLKRVQRNGEVYVANIG